MRKAIVAAALLASSTALAVPTTEEGTEAKNWDSGTGARFGLGVTLVDPLGASAKLFLKNPMFGFQFYAGYGWMSKPDMFRFGADILFHFKLASADIMDFLIYPGVGVGFGVGGNTVQLMFRAPVLGFAFHWKPVSLDTFIEGAWSPGIEFTGPTAFRAAQGDFAMGLRYYF